MKAKPVISYFLLTLSLSIALLAVGGYFRDANFASLVIAVIPLLFIFPATLLGVAMVTVAVKSLFPLPTNETKKIKKAPGTLPLSIVEFFYSPTTVEETFKPLVADWQMEYFDALSQKRRWKARWISFRYTCCFIHAMGLSKALDFVRSFTRAGK